MERCCLQANELEWNHWRCGRQLQSFFKCSLFQEKKGEEIRKMPFRFWIFLCKQHWLNHTVQNKRPNWQPEIFFVWLLLSHFLYVVKTYANSARKTDQEKRNEQLPLLTQTYYRCNDGIAHQNSHFVFVSALWRKWIFHEKYFPQSFAIFFFLIFFWLPLIHSFPPQMTDKMAHFCQFGRQN